ncbi:MAG: hypothetical protein Q9162_000499 [Coniocarpon cinnabarinum]
MAESLYCFGSFDPQNDGVGYPPGKYVRLQTWETSKAAIKRRITAPAQGEGHDKIGRLGKKLLQFVTARPTFELATDRNLMPQGDPMVENFREFQRRLEFGQIDPPSYSPGINPPRYSPGMNPPRYSSLIVEWSMAHGSDLEPVGHHPQENSALVRLLNKDLVQCMTDHLWFPDVFALALSCKSLHAIIPLTRKKTAYAVELSAFKPKVPPMHGTCRYFCAVCLYHLDTAYFGRYDWIESPGSKQLENGLRICRSCAEFRRCRAGAWAHPSGGDAYPTWRPSERFYVSEDSDTLWYRRRL